MNDKTKWEKFQEAMDNLMAVISEFLWAVSDTFFKALETLHVLFELLWFNIRLRKSDVFNAVSTRRWMHEINNKKRAGAIKNFILNVNPDYVLGLDCSHWTGPVNFSEAYNFGVRFAFIKGADGAAGPTRFFEQNYANAQENGIYRSPYFWLYPGWAVSIKTQIATWWGIIEKNGLPDMPVVIDFEWTRYAGNPANPTIGDLRAAVQAWMSISGGMKPLIYTSVGYLGETGPIPQDIIDMTAGIWCAHYGVTTPSVPKEYERWTFWQWTDQFLGSAFGYDPMYSKAADANYFNGTLEELEEWLGISSPVEPEVPEETETFSNGVTITNGHRCFTDYTVLTIPEEELYEVRFIATGTARKLTEILGDIVINATPAEVGSEEPNMGVRSYYNDLYPYEDWNAFAGWVGSKIIIDHKETIWNTIESGSQGFRYIIKNGQSNDHVSDAWDVSEPRTFVARGADGATIFIQTKGRNGGQKGWTLWEAAFYAFEHGISDMVEWDGGKSVGRIVRTGLDELYFSGTGDNEPLPSICVLTTKNPFYPKEEPEPYLWKGVTLAKVGVFRHPTLSGHVRGVRRKGLTFQGPIVNDGETHFMEIDSEKYLPVEDMDFSRKWMDIEPIYPNPLPEEPKSGFWQVLRDDETTRWNGYIRGAAPAPAVWTLIERPWVMDERTQRFFASLLGYSKYKMSWQELVDDALEQRRLGVPVAQAYSKVSDIASAFTGVYRSDAAMTNNHGFYCQKFPQERRNWIKNENHDKELPRLDKIRAFSDNIIKGRLSDDGLRVIVDRFDTVPEDYDISILNDPRVIRATIIKEGSSGSSVITDWPQLNGYPVYSALMSNYTLEILAEYVKPVTGLSLARYRLSTFWKSIF